MNRGLDTRLRRLERNAPDPVQAAFDALSDEDLDVALSVIRARIAAAGNGAAELLRRVLDRAGDARLGVGEGAVEVEEDGVHARFGSNLKALFSCRKSYPSANGKFIAGRLY